MTLEAMVIKEGYGMPALHLREPSRRVKQLFGRADDVRKGEGAREYWIYRKQGFDCLISTGTQRILSIFFYREGCDGHSGANVVTSRGIRPADSDSKVKEAYGEPYKAREAFMTNAREYVRGWASYQGGIGFHFDQEKRVAIIGIFSTKGGWATLHAQTDDSALC